MYDADPDRLLAQARAALARGDVDGALAATRGAAGQVAARGEHWLALAELLHSVGRDAEARPALDRALALLPGSSAARLLDAVLDNLAGAPEQGERKLRELLAHEPHHAAARANLASLLERGNRTAEAEREARAGLKYAPYEPLLNLVVAQCALHRRDLDSCELYLGRSRQGLERDPRHQHGALPQNVAYLGARLLAARDRHDEAYAAFAEANRIAADRAARRGIDGRRFLEELAAEADAAAPARVATWTALPPPASLPFRPAFLVGFPRSGTTLLEQVLDAHPAVVGLEEQGCFEEALDAIPGGHPAGLAALTAAERDRARDRYAAGVLALRPAAAGQVLVDKLPLRAARAGAVHRLVPEARFILALRHPYDVVLSCFMQEFGINPAMANLFTLADAARLYHATLSLWQRHREQHGLAVVTVRYEALVEDLEGQVRPVLDHLGVDWDPRVEAFAEHALSRGRIRTPSYSQVRQGLYTQARGRYLRYAARFTPEVRALLDPWVERLGYGAPNT